MPFPYIFPIIFGELPGTQIVIKIADAIPHLVKGTLSIDQRIEERSIASFTLFDSLGADSYERGQLVSIWDITDTRIFDGFIADPEMRRISPGGGIYHAIRCIDNHYLADKRLVIASYTNENAGDIVTDLLANYLTAEGVGLGEIQNGEVVSQAIFNYVSVAEALDALAELSGFTWYIDEAKDLYFIDRATNLTDWNWSLTTPKPEGSVPSLSGANPLYRNRQYIRGGTGLTAEQEEITLGDDETQSFAMGYPLAKVPTITVEDLPAQTVGIKTLDTGKNWYWSKGDAVIFAAIAPLDGKKITVTYFGQYPLITLALDEAEQTARAAIEGGTGFVENIIDEVYHLSLIHISEPTRPY